MESPDLFTEGTFCVVDKNHPLFWPPDGLTWMDQLSTQTTQVDSLDSMISACQRHVVDKGRPIDCLAVFGHGTSGYQAVGAGKEYEDTGTKSICYRALVPRRASHLAGPAAGKIAALNGVLSDDAYVFLAGCNVGEGDSGSGLLSTVSRTLNNRRVGAFTNKVYWWTGYLFGTLKTARGRFLVSEYAVVNIPSAM